MTAKTNQWLVSSVFVVVVVQGPHVCGEVGVGIVDLVSVDSGVLIVDYGSLGWF